jgi:hypothetical protein
MIIFDMDGTLSLIGERIKFIQKPLKDWDSFYEACDQDQVNEPVAAIFRSLCATSSVKIVTGRRESVRQKTLDWIQSRLNVRFDSINLHMRKDKDFRSDTIVKPELIKPFAHEIVCIFEDRKAMVDQWRSMGICCLQVADGNF